MTTSLENRWVALRSLSLLASAWMLEAICVR